MHKPTRDKIARAAGYVPKAQKPARAPVSVTPEVACVEPSPSAPVVAMGDLGRTGPLALAQLPMTTPGGGFPSFGPGPGGPVVLRPTEDVPPPAPPGGGVIPAIPEPATWTLMVFGFGLVGTAVRRTSRTSTANRKKENAEA
jgi:hypothetical protein